MFRILSLDGGGIKGVFTAAVLASIEADTKLKILDHFDLIAGTSTGGIIAIGLAMGLTAEELLTFYRERGPRIFPAMSLIERTGGVLRQIFMGPKVSTNPRATFLHPSTPVGHPQLTSDFAEPSVAHLNRRLARESWLIAGQPMSLMSRSSSVCIKPSARSTPAWPAAAKG
jgi:Patatin-like phospholipase